MKIVVVDSRHEYLLMEILFPLIGEVDLKLDFIPALIKISSQEMAASIINKYVNPEVKISVEKFVRLGNDYLVVVNEFLADVPDNFIWKEITEDFTSEEIYPPHVYKLVQLAKKKNII